MHYRSPASSFAIAFAAVSLAACIVVTPASGPTASSGASGAAAGGTTAATPAAEPAIACPSDLTVVEEGPVNLEQDGSRDGPAYESMKFVPEHRKPVVGDASFALDATAAVDKIAAIEEKTPLLVPAGFREELATHRRDAAFRLRMAACELDQRTLQRRAAVDLGIALLLGADGARVDAAASNLWQPPLCRKDSFRGDHACIMARSDWQDWTTKTKVSLKELDLEDAVSRGLASFPAPKDEFHWPAGNVLYRLAHKCGGSSVCLSRAHKVEGKTRFVHWDRRDGGAHHDMQPSAATAKSNKRCKDATGWEGQESCLQACWSGGRSGADGATCRTRCLTFCDPH